MQNLTAPRTYSEVKATKKMRWWYEQLADFMLAHPQALQNEIAAHFGRSAGTLSTIINSDAYQAYYRQRRGAYVGALDDRVREKMLTVADKGFDLILDRFDKKRDSIPIDTLNKTVEMALKASGHGAAVGGPGTIVNVNAPHSSTMVSVPVSLADLQEAQQALRNSQNNIRPDPVVVDGEFTEVPEPADADDLA